MIANVNEQLWIDFGLETAVFLDTIAYWLKKNSYNKQPRNFHEGKYWTYNTQEAFQKMFPGWSRETIRRIIRNCVKNGLLIVNKFNSKNYDRTNWYSLPNKALEYYPALWLSMGYKPESDGEPLVDSNQALVDSNQPIPKDLPSSSNNTITTASSSKPKTKKTKGHELMREMIEVYREEFPDNPQTHKTLISTSLERVLQTFIKRWPEADPHKRSFSLESFRDYMKALKILSPNFALGEYVTKEGNKKKNGMETFCRWNTFVKFLEDQYS